MQTIGEDNASSANIMNTIMSSDQSFKACKDIQKYCIFAPLISSGHAKCAV